MKVDSSERFGESYLNVYLEGSGFTIEIKRKGISSNVSKKSKKISTVFLNKKQLKEHIKECKEILRIKEEDD